MKTVKKNNDIKRVKDDVAQYMVSREGWEYCPKNLWKNKLEVTVKEITVEELKEEKISDNMSDKKKRKIRKENKRKKHTAKN